MNWQKKNQGGTSGSGGSTVTPSTINGNVKVDGNEIQVYDDDTLQNNSHTHSNKVVLDKFGQSGSSPTFNGVVIGAGGGGSLINVTPDMIEGVVNENNLFNKDTAITTGYHSWDTGVFNTSTSFYSSDFIPVSGSTTYTRSTTSSTRGILFYDENQIYISGLAVLTITTPVNCAYVRLAVKKEEIDSTVFWEGDKQPEVYIPYGGYYTLPSDKFRIGNEMYKANSTVPLFIETYYDGGNQPMHAKVISLTTAISGYKYWMAYTPLPYADEDEENPCIAVSNDLIKWVTPNGLTNPIDRFIKEEEDYLSDTHLFYNPDTSKLECWYRGYSASRAGEVIYRKTSSDGITWSTRETLKDNRGSNTAIKFLSPVVIYENGTYKIWVVYDKISVDYYESSTGNNWTFIRSLPISGWHLDVEKTDVGYEMVISRNLGTDNWDFIHYVSPDNTNWENRGRILRNDPRSFSISKSRVYRPSLLKVDGIYYFFYCASTTDFKWHTTLSIATEKDNIKSLKGIDASYIPLMAKPTGKAKYANVGDQIFDTTLNKPIWCKTAKLAKSPAGVGATWVDANGTVV